MRAYVLAWGFLEEGRLVAMLCGHLFFTDLSWSEHQDPDSYNHVNSRSQLCCQTLVAVYS